MEEIITLISTLVTILLVAVAIGFILALPIKWCWNYTIPGLFGLNAITWGQAWCLNFLTSCFFQSTQTYAKKED